VAAATILRRAPTLPLRRAHTPLRTVAIPHLAAVVDPLHLIALVAVPEAPTVAAVRTEVAEVVRMAEVVAATPIAESVLHFETRPVRIPPRRAFVFRTSSSLLILPDTPRAHFVALAFTLATLFPPSCYTY
jgi:hypothetical protein